MEWMYSAHNTVLAVTPFLGYFLGVIIRRLAFPGRRSLPLGRQILLGIPVSVIVVTAFLPILHLTKTDLAGFLVAVGALLEHGMLLNEPITYHLSRLSMTSDY
jgi:hypothetical protein